MSSLDVVAPRAGVSSVSDVLTRLATPTWTPFDDLIIDFCSDLSRQLSRGARGIPELQALAFWMRRAELVRLKESYAALGSEHELLVPRGLVFHVPPANVDTIFLYSWLLSALVGNRNVVRVPSRVGPSAEIVLEVLADLLSDERYAQVAASTAFVSYGHEREITDALSAACDVRVIWGGDATIETIRQSPLGPQSSELTFADRLSFAVVNAGWYAQADETARDQAAERFFNDSYWFDQMGCSSPRIVYWIGDEVGLGPDDFFARVDAVKRAKGYEVDTATALSKIAYSYRSVLDLGAEQVHRLDNEMTVIDIPAPTSSEGDFSGAGTFLQVRCANLGDLLPVITRRDQTVSHLGFGTDDLHALAIALNGRGIDRFVPFGEALTFNRIWDGNDLLQSFSRRVWLDIGPVV